MRPHRRKPTKFPVAGILQARTLERVAISFSNAWQWKVKGKSLSHVQLLVTPWTTAYQAPLPMGFSRQEYWSGVPFRHIQNFFIVCTHSFWPSDQLWPFDLSSDFKDNLAPTVPQSHIVCSHHHQHRVLWDYQDKIWTDVPFPHKQNILQKEVHPELGLL